MGFDVSHHNGTINFVQAKSAGYQFVYIKATEGTSFKDNMFLTNVQGAKSAGILAGAYHFARPESNSATNEAWFFINTIKTAGLDIIPVLDLESPTDNAFPDTTALVKWVNDFAYLVTSQLGKPCMVYTGNWYVNMNNNLNGAMGNYPLWIANYSTSTPSNCGGWTKWDVFQYSDKGVVAGVTGDCDVNVAMSLDFLKTGKYPAPIVVPETYTVVSGDTLSKISTKYGVSVTNIKLYNNLTSDLILVGQVLRLKPYDTFDVTVNGQTFKALYAIIDGVKHTHIEYACLKAIPQVQGWVVDDKGKFTINYVDVQSVPFNNNWWIKWNSIVGDKLTATWLDSGSWTFSSFHDYVVLADLADQMDAIKADNGLTDTIKIGQVLKIRN